jgi:hypothetical protein
MKVLAIGDIHTKIWIIKAIERLIDNYDAVVFVGDYADDWNADAIDSINTWRYLMDLQNRYPGKVRLVTGNHDYIYVNDTPSKQSGYNIGTQVLIDVPESKDLKEWLSELPITLEIDGITYSHAGVAASYMVGDTLWDDDSPLWVRPGSVAYKDIPQVFGHTPSKTCWEVQPNVWCIDTFSTYPINKLDGPSDQACIGDYSILEVTDGKKFNIRKLRNAA